MAWDINEMAEQAAESAYKELPKTGKKEINKIKLIDGMSIIFVPLPPVRGACEKGYTELVTHYVARKRGDKGGLFTACGGFIKERCLVDDFIRLYQRYEKVGKIPEADRIFFSDAAECMFPKRSWLIPGLLLVTKIGDNTTNGDIKTVFVLEITAQKFFNDLKIKAIDWDLANPDKLKPVKLSRSGKISQVDELVDKIIPLQSGVLESMPKLDSWRKPRDQKDVLNKMINLGLLTADSSLDEWKLLFGAGKHSEVITKEEISNFKIDEEN